MSKQIGIIIAVVVLLAVAALAYMQFGGKSTNPTNNSTTTQDNTQESGSITGSIQSLLGGGKNVTCTINDFGSDTGGQAVVFVSDKNVRGDFSSLEDGRRMFSHFIQNAGTSYFWGDSTPQGIKMKVDLQAEAGKVDASQTNGIDFEKDFNYTCIPWTVDNSIFTPPTNVTFTDMSSMMNNMKAKTTGVPVGGSASCAGITDAAAKAACENAIQQYAQ